MKTRSKAKNKFDLGSVELPAPQFCESAAGTVVHTSTVDQAPVTNTSEPAVTEKQRKQNVTKQPRLRKGKLQAFQDMLLDILLGIVAQADPPTLLSLARVSPIFAELLLSKHHRFLWDNALSRDGFTILGAQTSEGNAHPITYIATIVYDHHCRESLCLPSFMAVGDDLCAAQRLSIFCMLAEGLGHAGFELDKELVTHAGALQPLQHYCPMFEGDSYPQFPPLSPEESRVIDEVLADSRNQFSCCGQSFTYGELESHYASKETTHKQPRPFYQWNCVLSDTRAPLVVSMVVLCIDFRRWRNGQAHAPNVERGLGRTRQSLRFYTGQFPGTLVKPTAPLHKPANRKVGAGCLRIWFRRMFSDGI